MLHPSGLSLHRHLPEGGWDELVLAARLVLGSLGTPTGVALSIYNQYLLEMPGGTSDQPADVAGRLFGGWSSDIGTTDFSVLLDGEDRGHAYQCEFGIVTRSEVPVRLARFLGRVHRPAADLDQLMMELDPEDVPDPGFFCDFWWRSTEPEEGVVELTEYCENLNDRSTLIVDRLFKRATAGADEHGESVAG